MGYQEAADEENLVCPYTEIVEVGVPSMGRSRGNGCAGCAVHRQEP